MPLEKGKSNKAFVHNLKTEMHHGKPQKQSLAIAYAMKRKAQHHKAQGGEMCAHGGEEHCMEGCYAEGGSVDSWTKREDNEKGINKVASGDKPGRSEAGASLHPAFSIGEDMDKEVAKRRHHKVLNEMRSMPKPKLMAEGGEMKSKRERAMHAFAGGGMMTNEGYQSHGKPEVDGDLMPAAHLKEELAEHVAHEPTHDSMVSHDVMNQMGDEDEGEGDMNMIDPLIKKIMMGRAKGYSEGGKVANEESGESSDEPTMAKWEGNEFDDLALRDDLESKYTGANSGDEEDDLSEAHDRDDIVKRVMKSRHGKDRMAVPGEGRTYGKRR